MAVQVTLRNEDSVTFEKAESFDIGEDAMIQLYNEAGEIFGAVHPQSWQRIHIVQE